VALRHTRYQGAVLRGSEMLLLAIREHGTGREFWVIPGGGIEPGESAEDCIRREMKEETGLEVRVERLLLDEPALSGGIYKWVKTYACASLSSEPAPGFAPQEDIPDQFDILGLRWLDLTDPQTWGPAVITDPFTYPGLLKIRAALGY
jgi:8-oxo-dGTP diphosphatase